MSHGVRVVVFGMNSTGRMATVRSDDGANDSSTYCCTATSMARTILEVVFTFIGKGVIIALVSNAASSASSTNFGFLRSTVTTDTTASARVEDDFSLSDNLNWSAISHVAVLVNYEFFGVTLDVLDSGFVWRKLDDR
jgi:hypothetical protein